MRRSPALFLAIGSVIGALGAFVLARVGLTPAGWSVVAILLGAVLGGCFALMTRSRATTPGAGLLWALAFSLLLWLAGPACMLPRVTSHGAMGMLDAARAHFAELVGYLLVFGAPLGLVLGALSVGKPSLRSTGQPFSFARALVAGGLAGIVGGWAFGQWMEKAHFFPLIAGLGGILLAWTWKDAALFHRRDHRSDVRPAFSTRRSRIRIESGLGPGLRYLLVVSRAADPQATFTGARAGLVTRARTRTVRLAHGSYRLRPDCRRDLRRFGQTLGRLLHR